MIRHCHGSLDVNLRHAPDTALSPDPPKDYDALGRALAEAQDVRRLWGLTLGYLRARRGIVGGVYMLNRREDELQRLTTAGLIATTSLFWSTAPKHSPPS